MTPGGPRLLAQTFTATDPIHPRRHHEEAQAHNDAIRTSFREGRS